MPTTVSIGAASAKAFGFTLGTSNIPSNYFMAGIALADSTPTALYVDSNDNVMVFGGIQAAFFTNDYGFILIIKKDGTFQLKNQVLESSPDYLYYIGGVIESSLGGLYITTTSFYPSSGDVYDRVNILPCSTSGAISTGIGNTNGGGFYGSIGSVCAVNSSGDVFVLGLDTEDYNWIYRYSSSLTPQKDYHITSTTGIIILTGVGITSTNKIVVTGMNYLYGGNYSSFVGLFPMWSTSTTTTSTWAKYLTPASGTDNRCIAAGIDASDNVYALTLVSGTNYTFILSKYDSSGAVQWHRQWSESGTANTTASNATEIKFDSSSNLYVAYRSPNNSGSIVVAKFDTNGNTVFFRSLYCSGYAVSPSTAYNNSGVPTSQQALKIKSSTMYFTGVIGGGTSAFTFAFKVPTDGTLTQSFTIGGYSMTYATYSPTVSTPTPTVTSFSMQTEIYTPNTVTDTTITSAISPTASTKVL